VSEKCPRSVKEVPWGCPRKAKKVPAKFTRRAREVSEKCQRSAQEAKKSPESAEDVPMRCPGGPRKYKTSGTSIRHPLGYFSLTRRSAERKFGSLIV